MLIIRTIWAASFIILMPLIAVEAAAPSESFTIPFRITKSSHLVVRAKINNKGPYYFVVDTGAPVSFFSEESGKKIGLNSDDKNWCNLDSFLIEGGLSVQNYKIKLETPFQLVGMNGMALGGVELHGLIGYDLIAQYKIEIDVSKESMTWTSLDFKPKLPLGVSGKNSAGGLDALGSIMKTIGTISGKKQDSSPQLRGNLGIIIDPQTNPLAITQLISESPASKSGILTGDVIIKFNGTDVNSMAQLLKLYESAPINKPIQLHLLRKNKPIHIELNFEKGL